jgi:hypothetical protein
MADENLSPTTRAHLSAVQTIADQLGPKVKDGLPEMQVDWGEVMREIHADRIGAAEFELRAAIQECRRQGVDVQCVVRDELSGGQS